ncbi:Thiol-disulfide oxidoreductase ResA [Planctopirus ephydatiae]|uniref:Thiol-disulfide oxidoreductase ResA n=1 Tax=Planctopirus ephydatiae TaxID=2528019 RepID=A0A518GR76_9PLAN|nr:TlpA disulfide reductase family protein [Planctopirus ephydatiae]QDV31082.1 Thiol-disulfide oxidoreductase ResA [Planctopirus ephydatiae]
MIRINCSYALILSLLTFAAAGCSDTAGTTIVGTNSASEAVSPGDNPSVVTSGQPGSALPVASIPAPGSSATPGNADDDEPEEPLEPLTETPEPEKGSPEWAVREILRIRLLPYPVIETAAADNPASQEKLREQMEAQKKLRTERNKQIIELATGALAVTAKDKAQERLFTVSAHHLLESHLQLALQGDAESTSALYDIAAVFFENRPESDAAAEAQQTVVSLAHSNALRSSETEPRWLIELSRQSQLYATRFPKDSAKSLPFLLAAATSCEMNGQLEEAVTCYRLIEQKFPGTPEAQQITNVLRRIDLPGKSLELAGPALDGNFITMDEYRGKAVLVVFWSTASKPFRDQLPQLLEISKKYEKYCVTVGVNLDLEESAVDRFLEETGVSWPQIFHSERAKRGWNHPLATHYGINTLPTIWLIDPQGTVISTQVQPSTLEPELREVLLKHLRAAKAQETNQN